MVFVCSGCMLTRVSTSSTSSGSEPFDLTSHLPAARRLGWKPERRAPCAGPWIGHGLKGLSSSLELGPGSSEGRDDY